MINQIARYCMQNYTCLGNCSNCLGTVCEGDKCEGCLHEIHHTAYPEKGYNCATILKYYVPKFYYKYASEMYYAIQSLPNKDIFNHFNIASFGCGASPDLVGIINSLNNNLKLPLVYRGFEINKNWQDIQDEVKNTLMQYYPLLTYNIHNVDILTLLTQPLKNANMLIFQYVISSLLKVFDEDVVNSFLDDVMKYIIPYMEENACIIFNDTNSNGEGRDIFTAFGNKLAQKGWNLYQAHFNIDHKNYTYPYGYKHSTNAVTSPIDPAIVSFCNPHIKCTSAQLIIYR